MSDAASSVDLTPRPPRAGTRRSKWLPLALLVAIALAIIGLIWFLITNSQAFLEADIAVSQREEQADRRFQLLGSPIADADKDDAVFVDGDQLVPFTIAFDGVKVDVLSLDTPPDLFGAGIPVVLEGRWVEGPAPAGIVWPGGANDGWYFESDRILVKHDNDYREDRLTDAEDRGQPDALADE
ncbi:MAG: cytochrome c maturation protein CcmE [Acidimicrobiales bacterium]